MSRRVFLTIRVPNRLAFTMEHEQNVPDGLFASLEWRCIGPHRGGRVVAVAGHPADRATFYFGAVGGGVWKTTNGGSHWRNISDGYFNTAAVGALAVAPGNPNVIYAGTGEATIRSDVSHGDGVYRTVDGGRTWEQVGLNDTKHIGAIIVHPTNPDIVFVAALGHAFGPNDERGVFRSQDGGNSWQRVLYKSDKAGAIDLAFDGTNPRIIYASILQARRYPWKIDSGGGDSGLWRSVDGGDTWDDISHNHGLPQGMLGKISVTTTKARPGRVWALVEAEDGALFRSDDYGESWIRLCEDAALRTRAWYYIHVVADPGDENTLWVLNRQYWKSIDGGISFFQVPSPHADNHALWIDPNDSQRMIQGNDGGACVSFDGGETWSTVLNQPTAQFYRVTTDQRDPYFVYGSQQDNWAMRLPSCSPAGAITWADYVEPGGGESGYIAVKPTPPYTVYGGGTGTGPGDGRMLAWNPATRQARNVSINQHLYSRWATSWLKHRFQWTFPIEISPHNPEMVYACSQYVHRSDNEGANWTEISPDLTRNDASKMLPGGGPITPEWGASDVYCTISSFRESPHQEGVFWAGSDDGLVHLSRDGGNSWLDITPVELPEWCTVNMLEPSPHVEGGAYLAAFRYMLDDTSPYLFKTTDFGRTWTRIDDGLPDGEFTRVIREDTHRRGLLYVGTETGIYVSFDDGGTWHRLPSGTTSGKIRQLPVAPMYDLQVKGNNLVVATHGRSFWILDDLSPLRQFSVDLLDNAIHLFKPHPTTLFRQAGRMFEKPLPGLNYQMTGSVTVALDPVETPMGTYRFDFLDAGSNPPEGVIIHYWLREKQSGDLTLTISDASGDIVRIFTNDQNNAPWLPAHQGMNRVVWDFRYAGATPADNQPELPDVVPPRAIPGTYTVRLESGTATQTCQFDLLPDPRLPVSLTDLKALRDLQLDIRDSLSKLHDMVNDIHALQARLDFWLKRGEVDGSVRETCAELLESLQDIEKALIQLDPSGKDRGRHTLNERLSGLSFMIDEADYAPTTQAVEAFQLIGEDLEEQCKQLRLRIDATIPALNEQLQKSGMDFVVG